MRKTKTSNKPSGYTENGSEHSSVRLKKQARPYNPEEELLDENLIARGVWECLCANDPSGAMEIIETHLWAKDRSKKAREKGVARTTVYHAFKSRNPTLSTLARMLHNQ